MRIEYALTASKRISKIEISPDMLNNTVSPKSKAFLRKEKYEK